VGSDRTVQIALTEYRLSPQSISVSAGSLTIRVHNFGRLTHNLVISENGQRAAATKDLWPGQDDAITLTLPPGTYRLSSTILSDEALGEFGTLRVSR
jgi:plastocyanin